MKSVIKEFFLDRKEGIPFVLFGKIHIGCILIVLVSFLLIHHYRAKIKHIPKKYHKPIKWTMFLILFLNMAIYYGSYVYYGVYNWKVHLPLHICFIAGEFFMFYLLTGKRNFYKVIFPLTFIGPLPAIIYPDLKSSFDYFVFYQYFISHHLLMIFSYFLLYMEDYTITLKDIFKTLLLGNAIFIVMSIFNHIFGTNYIMSNGLPSFILELYPFLKNIWPPLVLEVVGTFVLLCIYGLAQIKNKEDVKEKN